MTTATFVAATAVRTANAASSPVFPEKADRITPAKPHTRPNNASTSRNLSGLRACLGSLPDRMSVPSAWQPLPGATVAKRGSHTASRITEELR
jgi:hypothetical protein